MARDSCQNGTYLLPHGVSPVLAASAATPRSRPPLASIMFVTVAAVLPSPLAPDVSLRAISPSTALEALRSLAEAPSYSPPPPPADKQQRGCVQCPSCLSISSSYSSHICLQPKQDRLMTHMDCSTTKKLCNFSIWHCPLGMWFTHPMVPDALLADVYHKTYTRQAKLLAMRREFVTKLPF